MKGRFVLLGERSSTHGIGQRKEDLFGLARQSEIVQDLNRQIKFFGRSWCGDELFFSTQGIDSKSLHECCTPDKGVDNRRPS
jgi:hypothetical protein